MNVWGKYNNSPAEKIDEAPKSEVYRLANEYRIAFGSGWTIWVGRKSDGPK